MCLSVDFSKQVGEIKRMNAVNNGPVLELHRENPFNHRNNLHLYKDLNIPYARLHDTPFFPEYGGDHVADVHLIFRDFDADPYNSENYDFVCTDQLLKVIFMAGTKPFYRLGCSIEGHLPKKYAIHPPKDFKKWAIVCEHIIAHYVEGWADGFNYDIEYWEIWNEPNSVGMWLGTPEEFNNFYVTVGKHLKSRFPDLKIGGPAFCNLDSVSTEVWARPFLKTVKESNAPLDFFSWHGYTREIGYIVNKLQEARKLLDEYGFSETESILNEWNYAQDFSVEEYKTLLSVKGAAFTSAYMSVCQDGPLDMLMYYDARPTVMNNLFDYCFLEPLKGYYVLKIWGELLKNKASQCKAASDENDVYVTAAKYAEEEIIIITYYTDKANCNSKSLTLKIKNNKKSEKTLLLLDENTDAEKVGSVKIENDECSFEIKPNTVIVLR